MRSNHFFLQCPRGRSKKLIRGDADLATIAHFVTQGYPLRELVSLRPMELAFLRCAWMLELEYVEEAFTRGNKNR